MTTPDPPRTPTAGALLGTFAGDALGRPYEGAPPLAARDGRARLRQAGRLVYTDDTQLALALAEHLVDHPHVEPEALRATFLEHIEPDRGYGAGMRRLVAHWRSGMPTGEAATAVFEDGSFGNGAAMRVAAVGTRWRDDPAACTAAAARQAGLTHVHPLGTAGAVLQAAAVATAARTGRFGRDELAGLAGDDGPDLPGELADELDRAVAALERWRRSPELTLDRVALGRGVVAHRSVPGALWCAAVGGDPERAVCLALGLGGDVDTIAAMAGAVAGAAAPASLPGAWLAAMEDGSRGRVFAASLAERLEDRDRPGGGR